MNFTKEQFESKLNNFLIGCQSLIANYHTKNQFTWPVGVIKVETGGRKYIKINVHEHGNKYIYCFIDLTTGDILKPASYKAPAKHSRGNLFNDDNGLTNMNWFGPKYLK